MAEPEFKGHAEPGLEANNSLASRSNRPPCCPVRRMAISRIILLILISLRLLGGDSGILQAVAWAGMLVSRAPEQGLAAAVESTFDGAHPCSLCTAIKKVEQQSPASREPVNIELLGKLKIKHLVCPQDVEMEAPAGDTLGAGLSSPALTRAAGARRDAPPVPPPRRESQARGAWT